MEEPNFNFSSSMVYHHQKSHHHYLKNLSRISFQLNFHFLLKIYLTKDFYLSLILILVVIILYQKQFFLFLFSYQFIHLSLFYLQIFILLFTLSIKLVILIIFYHFIKILANLFFKNLKEPFLNFQLKFHYHWNYYLM